MSKNTKGSFNAAVHKGMIRMKKSNDAIHDFKHAENVERTALIIAKNLTNKNISENWIKIAAYWHDVYKASKSGFSISLVDGKGSGTIFQKNLGGGTLPEREFCEILKAIINHDRILKYFLFPKSFSTLSALLIEADMLDLYDIDRWKRGVSTKNMTYFQQVIFTLFELVAMSILPNMFKFDLSRKIHREKARKFWNFLLFKEKYLLKILMRKV